MRKNLFLLLFAFFSVLFYNAQKIEFKNIENKTLDYGTINKNDNGARVVQIKNVGDKPLLIKNISSSCGCTVPNWPKTPIAPGKIAKITITYATSRVGQINKTVTIESNDVTSERILIKVTGLVKDTATTEKKEG